MDYELIQKDKPNLVNEIKKNLKGYDAYIELFNRALVGAAQIYTKHREKKGDSWKHMDVDYLRCRLYQEFLEWDEEESAEIEELLDLINIALMLVTRLYEEGDKSDQYPENTFAIDF